MTKDELHLFKIDEKEFSTFDQKALSIFQREWIKHLIEKVERNDMIDVVSKAYQNHYDKPNRTKKTDEEIQKEFDMIQGPYPQSIDF
jgi:hypothetical protein